MPERLTANKNNGWFFGFTAKESTHLRSEAAKTWNFRHQCLMGCWVSTKSFENKFIIKNVIMLRENFLILWIENKKMDTFIENKLHFSKIRDSLSGMITAENQSKHSTVSLLCLLWFSLHQTLVWKTVFWLWKSKLSKRRNNKSCCTRIQVSNFFIWLI